MKCGGQFSSLAAYIYLYGSHFFRTQTKGSNKHSRRQTFRQGLRFVVCFSRWQGYGTDRNGVQGLQIYQAGNFSAVEVRGKDRRGRRSGQFFRKSSSAAAQRQGPPILSFGLPASGSAATAVLSAASGSAAAIEAKSRRIRVTRLSEYIFEFQSICVGQIFGYFFQNFYISQRFGVLLVVN